ncbi:guanine deaminase [Bacteroidaceae bacterium]|uniref:nucleoside deaminase n=1 Tax=Prevotella sp. MGM2 TaxID=2033406 RepID=UPI000CE9DEBA|nr:nucleoside deaminase [Prevotella sp. MGM2]GAY29231.1 nucleoside deaminase [Prevotella sp. MGM2]GFI33602.1 guanine deaminase [Bacteroidaceae bacterium]
MTHKELMKRAIELATENVSRGGGPFGAVIARNGNIIAEGVNRVTANHDPTAHAEVQAIRAAASKLGSFTLEGCDIYASCEPCPMCLGAIYWARLSRLFYGGTQKDAAAAGFDDAFIYKELELQKEERRLPSEHLLHDEALGAFKAWCDNDKKTAY